MIVSNIVQVFKYLTAQYVWRFWSASRSCFIAWPFWGEVAELSYATVVSGVVGGGSLVLASRTSGLGSHLFGRSERRRMLVPSQVWQLCLVSISECGCHRCWSAALFVMVVASVQQSSCSRTLVAFVAGTALPLSYCWCRWHLRAWTLVVWSWTCSCLADLLEVSSCYWQVSYVRIVAQDRGLLYHLNHAFCGVIRLGLHRWAGNVLLNRPAWSRGLPVMHTEGGCLFRCPIFSEDAF